MSIIFGVIVVLILAAVMDAAWFYVATRNNREE
jgi:hypothetical protein